MNKQSAKAQDGEIMMRMMASVFGQDILSFVADFKLENGEEEHAPVQVLGTDGDVAKAAHGIFDDLIAQGKIPQVIWYIPGDHSMEELTAMLDDPEIPETLVPVYVSWEALEEVGREGAGKSTTNQRRNCNESNA